MKHLRHKEEARIGGTLVISAYRDGRRVRQTAPMHNKVVTGSGGYGRNLIIRQLAGDDTYPLEIDSAALGDNNTAAADGDTALGNQLVGSISITNMTVANNQLQVDVFVADGSLADDTYAEFGLFCGGRLFARIVISPAYTKASGEDTLFTYSLSLTG